MTALAAIPAAADTLRDALVAAYKTNPALAADRAGVRALDENVPIARSGGLPSVRATGNYTENVLSSGDSLFAPAREAQAGTQLVVPVYTGGRVTGSVRAAETRVDAGRAQLRGSESDLFVGVVGAYMDVIRDEAIVALNQENVKVLNTNLEATRDRFQVGDLTRTDVAQSEARLSIARATLDQSRSQLIASRENYVRLVGNPPGTLETPPALPNLPAASDDAVDLALKNNPALIGARRAADATRFDVDVAKSARLPQISGVAGGSYYNYLGSYGAGTGVRPDQSGTAGTVGVQLTLPLFQAGLPAAQIRQAQERRVQAIDQATDVERGVIAQTRSAYAMWKSALQVITSSEAAVSANKLSLEGVRAENSVGNRTILDILNAEQELLNSQVTLVSARRDAYVAGFALLAAMGLAEARDLGLDGGVLYDPTINFNRVRNRIGDWSTGPVPQAGGTSTVGTAPQDATVTRPLDPELNQPVDTTTPNPAGVGK
ncbi:TolC family outer membrane protein [uncultured Sphingomonas sp.]|uniref:TolC family outer membrane protein n=1 Tax=uncultured Sphingomonas sp. TaxID=158754 RepID=UPI0035CC2396